MSSLPKGNPANKVGPLKPRQTLLPKVDNSFDNRDNWRYRNNNDRPMNGMRQNFNINNNYGRKTYPRRDYRDPLKDHHRELIHYIQFGWSEVLRALGSYNKSISDEPALPKICYYKSEEFSETTRRA